MMDDILLTIIRRRQIHRPTIWCSSMHRGGSKGARGAAAPSEICGPHVAPKKVQDKAPLGIRTES